MDWSSCPLAMKFGVTGETKGGPRRRVNVAPIPGLDFPQGPMSVLAAPYAGNKLAKHPEDPYVVLAGG